MTNTELMHELMLVREKIQKIGQGNINHHVLKENLLSRINDIIVDLLDEESSAMQKVDRLADAIEQATFISKTNKEPFKIAVVSRAEVEKMAKGGTD